MKPWIGDQKEKIRRFGTYLWVFILLRLPSRHNPRIKEIILTVFILLGMFQMGQAIHTLVFRPVARHPDPAMAVKIRRTKTTSETAPRTLRDKFNDSGSPAKPILLWNTEEGVVAISEESKPLETVEKMEMIPSLAKETRKESSLPHQISINQEKRNVGLSGLPVEKPIRLPFRWHASYTQMIFCVFGILAFGTRISRLLVKGNAPSLVRFFNCLVMLGLFGWEFLNFIEAPLYSSASQTLGILTVLGSAMILAYGFHSSYLDPEHLGSSWFD